VGLAAEGRAAECLDRVARGRPAAGRSPSPRAGGPTGPEAGEREAARKPGIDQLVVGMARAIADGDVVTTGLASALPMLAVALAKASHAPRARYINCVGAVDPEIGTASFTSV